MDYAHSALIIIDMQKDVLKHLVKEGTAIVPKIEALLVFCRKKQIPIIHLARMHRADSIDVERFRLETFKKQPFLVEGTEGASVIEELKPLSSEYVIPKKRFSGFFQTDLLMILTRLNIKSLFVCGLQTPNCVRATVVDALCYDFDVTLIEDAITAQTPQIHNANLFDMANMGAKIKKASEIMAN